MNPVLAIVVSLLMVFVVLGISALARRRFSAEVSRKLAHILLSHWILAALALFSEPWAVCVPPALFVALNWYSYRKNLFRGIEREQDNTPGTVWFAVSLLLLCAVFWAVELPWIAACGMLSMGWGDGLAALVGMRFGKRNFPPPCAAKTAEGTFTAALFSGIAVGILCAIYKPEIALLAGAVCGVVAATAELVFSRGLDNLFLPLSVSGCMYLLVTFPSIHALLFCLAVTLLILLVAFYLRAITPAGSLGALGVGLALFALGGIRAYGALIAFFVLGSLVSKLGRAHKKKSSALHEHHGARGAAQVFANALPALIWAILYTLTGWDRMLTALFASFAVTAADTFSSEIGMLSKKEPKSILTGKPVQAGMSGGVTTLGYFGSLLGAALLCPFAGWPRMVAVFLAGVAGGRIDSLLGALCQVKYRLPDGALTERPTHDGEDLPVASGFGWMNNDLVNFISAMAASVWMLLVP